MPVGAGDVRLVNEDPIDHEWLIVDAAFHEKTAPAPARGATDVPTEVQSPRSRRGGRDHARRPGTLQFICHLPGHEAYGMVGTLPSGADRRIYSRRAESEPAPDDHRHHGRALILVGPETVLPLDFVNAA